MNLLRIVVLVVGAVGVGLFLGVIREWLVDRREFKAARGRRAQDRPSLLEKRPQASSTATNGVRPMVGPGPTKPEPWLAPELRIK